MTSNDARGLFARAIVQSGAYALTEAPLATAEAAGESFATRAGCADQSADCLRALPVSAVLAQENPAGYQPDVDGKVLTESIGTALAAGRFNRVPLITGSNLDEWRLFVALDFDLLGTPVTAASYQNAIQTTLGVPPAVAAVIAARYPLSGYASPDLALDALGTDAIFACPALRVDAAAAQYVPTYAYEFRNENAPERFLPPVSFPYGAAHASEIQYLFDLVQTPVPGQLSPEQQQLSTTMLRYWTNFAERSFPSGFSTPPRPRYESAAPQMQTFDPPRPQLRSDFAAEHRCAFWGVSG
jgi:para-nitrobenzyl esterase